MNKILRHIIFITLISVSFLSYPQGILRNKGSSIVVSGTGALLYLSNVGYTNESNGSNHGLIDNDGFIKLTGDWTNNATAAANVVFRNFNANGSVQFIGSANQKINGSKTTYFENLTINNTLTSGDAITLELSPIVNQTLTLTDGVIGTGANTIIVRNSAAAAVTGNTSASFIHGNLRRYFINNTGTYEFPLGNGSATTNYYLAEMINKNLAGIDSLDAYFAAKPGNDAGLNIIEGIITAYNSVSTAGVWYITPNKNPSGGSFDLKLYIANVNDLNGEFNLLKDNQFAILSRITSSADAVNWACTPCGVGDPAGLNANGGLGRMVSDGYALRKGMTIGTTFGQYGIGLMEGNLPISLLSFNGICKNNSVELYWSTASETNNQYFIIERSSNATDWTDLVTLNGAGNSNSLISYHYTDMEPFSGNTYYRLKQIDFNGDYSYSEIISVSCSSSLQNSFGIIGYYANNNSLEMLINCEEEEAYNISIYDLLGKKVFHSDKTICKGISNITLTIPDFVESFYLLELRSNRHTISKKILLF